MKIIRYNYRYEKFYILTEVEHSFLFFNPTRLYAVYPASNKAYRTEPHWRKCGASLTEKLIKNLKEFMQREEPDDAL